LSHYSKFGSWGQWKSIRREKHLFNGWKKIEEDYAAVDFKNAVFEAGKLVFDVGVTPLQPIGETILSCEVVLSNGLPDHLFCKEKNLLNEGPCTTIRK
jgi:hypothetical protein